MSILPHLKLYRNELLQIRIQGIKEGTIVTILKKKKRIVTVARRPKGKYEAYTN